MHSATDNTLQNGWGATEAIATGLLESDREDHEYVSVKLQARIPLFYLQLT